MGMTGGEIDTFKQFFREDTVKELVGTLVTLLLVSLTLLVFAVVGFLGVWKDSKLFLGIYLIGMCCIAFTLMVLAILVGISKDEQTGNLKEMFREYQTIRENSTIKGNETKSQKDVVKLTNFLQERYDCCGFNGASDFKVKPDSCKNNNKGCK